MKQNIVVDCYHCGFVAYRVRPLQAKIIAKLHKYMEFPRHKYHQCYVGNIHNHAHDSFRN